MYAIVVGGSGRCKVTAQVFGQVEQIEDRGVDVIERGGQDAALCVRADSTDAEEAVFEAITGLLQSLVGDVVAGEDDCPPQVAG